MSSFRNCRGSARSRLAAEQVLHQPVGRGEEHRASGFHQPVAHGAQCMGLAGAGQSEGQHVDAAVDEAAVRQLAQLLPQSQGHTVVLEGLPSLAGGQSGRGAQPADAALPPVLGLLLQHFQEGLQGVAVPGGGESGHRLRPHGGQPELVAQLPDPDLNGVGVHHQATPASRES